MLIRILSVIILVGLINFYSAARIINRWDWAQEHGALAWSAAFLFFALQLVGPFGDHNFLQALRKKYKQPRLAFAIDWVSYFALGVMTLIVIYGFTIDLVNIALLATPIDPSRLDPYALGLLAAAVAASTAYGLKHGCDAPHVRTIDIGLKNLPQAFDGFRIAQISDLHVGPLIGRPYTQKVVDMANGLQPDVIALTGDFIDGYVDDLSDGVAPLAELKAPQGVFFVTGNHEYYWDPLAWIEKYKSLGLRVLLNEHVILRRDADAMILAGVTDYRASDILPSHASNPRQALASAPEGLIRILLAHQSASYKAAAEAGFDLQLSGHTHAGQYFPFTFLIRFFERFYKGLNRHGNLQVYVNTGTGYWGPPLKTSPSEVSLIVLRRA